jgi:hypothetical protein
MYIWRFTPLTDAVSKKIETHAYSFALFAMYYNFVRIHNTLDNARKGRECDHALAI